MTAMHTSVCVCVWAYDDDQNKLTDSSLQNCRFYFFIFHECARSRYTFSLLLLVFAAVTIFMCFFLCYILHVVRLMCIGNCLNVTMNRNNCGLKRIQDIFFFVVPNSVCLRKASSFCDKEKETCRFHKCSLTHSCPSPRSAATQFPSDPSKVSK